MTIDKFVSNWKVLDDIHRVKFLVETKKYIISPNYTIHISEDRQYLTFENSDIILEFDCSSIDIMFGLFQSLNIDVEMVS